MGLAVQTGNFTPRRPYVPRRVRNRNKRWEALSGSPGSIGPFSSDRFAREVEQAVAVVPVLRPACLDLGGEAVGQRCREGVEAVEDIDDLPLGGDDGAGISTLAKSTGATSITFAPFAAFRLDI